MCLNVIEVALDQRAYSTVVSSVAKAEGVLQTIISGGESAALAAGSIHTGGSKAGSVSVSSRGGAAGGNVAPVRRGAPTAGGDAIGALFRAGGSASASNGSASADLMSAGSGGGRGSREAKAKKVIRELQDKLHVANGIASLGLRRYDAALRSLSRVDINSSEPWNHVSMHDQFE
jgi:COP9 signalosome complex subunit 1